MNKSLLSSIAGWFIVLSAAVGNVSVRAQTAPAAPTHSDAVQMENYVLAASRTPQDPKLTPSAVSVVPLGDLRAAQIESFKTALAQQPGVILYSAGAVGSQSTVLLRGANAHQTLFFVDGVRMNDRSASYQNFLGGADLGGMDRVEVLRGPQSTLYGSSAMGGVILVDTTRGCAPFGGSLALSAGSFDSIGASGALQGGTKAFDYSVSLGYTETANDQPANDYRQWAYTTRLEYTPTPTLLFGATWRGQNGDFEEPGSRLFHAPGVVDTDNSLATVYGQASFGETFTSRLTLAAHRRAYAYASFGSVSAQRNRRNILDWQNTWAAATRAEIVAGVNYERSRFAIDRVTSDDDVAAGYVSTTLRPTDAVTVIGGVRYDDFESVGSAITWRTGASWRVATGTKLRATYGTGFSAPGADDRYGVPQWGQLANSNLAPEKSKGWDVGIEQDFLRGAATLSATYFKNEFRDLFEWEYVNFVTYEGRTVNRARASTKGAELAIAANPASAVRTRLSYTYLEAHNEVTGAPLARRPRHTGDAEVRVQAMKAWKIGAGVHFVADRLDGTRPFEDYTNVRVFTSYALTADLLLKLRIENALNEAYEEVYGYAALPRGVFGGVEWRF
ncbi:MAG: TonB-dependent receptor [Opitutaceae bacterium]|nr:TonB-dependent receptor [Opitutaceae bacterium]